MHIYKGLRLGETVDEELYMFGSSIKPFVASEEAPCYLINIL